MTSNIITATSLDALVLRPPTFVINHGDVVNFAPWAMILRPGHITYTSYVRRDVTGSFTLTGGGDYNAAGHGSTGPHDVPPINGGGDFSVTGFKAIRGALVPMTSGDTTMNMVGHKSALGQYALRGGDLALSFTGTGAVALVVKTGTFVLTGGGDYLILPTITSTTVVLVWNVSIDDHVRPQWHPLWSRFRYPGTKYALLLWRDGRVKEVSDTADVDEVTADYVITGGWYGPSDAWQAVVLANAGYTLVPQEA